MILKNRALRKFLSILLIAGMTLNCGSSLSASYIVKAANNNMESRMAALTAEQREALHKLQTTDESGLHVSPDSNLDSEEEISVIIEFKTKPWKVAVLEAEIAGQKLTESKAKNNVDKSHAAFKGSLNELSSTAENPNAVFKIKREFKNAFNGVEVVMPANKVKALLGVQEVKAVWGNEQVSLSLPAEDSVESNDVKPSKISPDLGINKLHEEGITGDGIKVGVIDTGIDYNHPDLKDAYKGGYDFVDDDSSPMETTYEDWKNSGKPEFDHRTGESYYTAHGTHVCGIIAGQGINDSEFSSAGVAPDADLYVYRVLGPYGSGSIGNILGGIDQAVADGMDVINLSLGMNVNDPLAVESIAVNNAVLSGITVCVASGNSGNNFDTLGTPGSSALALTVGASTTDFTVPTFKGMIQPVGQESVDFNLNLLGKGYTDDITVFNGKTYELVDAGFGGSYEYRNKDVAGKIVLVTRTAGTSFTTVVKAAKDNGAAGVFLYNTVPNESQIPYYFYEVKDFIPAFSLTNSEGLILKNQIKAGVNKFTFTEMGEFEVSGDTLADFSSRGPSRINYDIKPEIAAPGVDILSTVPSFKINPEDTENYDYAYQRMSGTSMAAPYVSGVAALLLQENPDLKPEDVKTVIMNTADPLKKDYSVFEAGAGRINPYKAVHSTSMIQVIDETPTMRGDKEKKIKERTGALSFGSIVFDGKNIKDRRLIQIYNTEDQNKTFDVEVIFNKGVGGCKDGDANGVKINIASTLKVHANGHTTINPALYIPGTAELGTYEGYISFTNKDNAAESYRVPFGVRVADKGFSQMMLSSPSFTTNIGRNMLSKKHVNAYFMLKSHMKYIDFYLVDGNTNEELGFLGELDGLMFTENVGYYVEEVFTGYYYPYVKDKENPISDTMVQAPVGYYKIKMVGTDYDGSTYNATTGVLIDNSYPTVQMNGDEQFVEYEPGTKSMTFSGKVYDQEIDLMKQLGMPFTQANNKGLVYFSTNPSYTVEPDEEGNFSYTTAIYSSAPTKIGFAGIDVASNIRWGRNYYLIQEGTPYISGIPDKNSITMGEDVTFTICANNVVNLKQATFSFYYPQKNIENITVTENPAMKEYGPVQIDTEMTPQGNMRVDITVTLGEDKALTGDFPMVDVTLKTNPIHYNQELMNNFSTKYTDTSGKVFNYVYSAFGDCVVNPGCSELTGYILAKGLYTPDGNYDYSLDYTNIGATVTVKDSKNNEYPGTIDKKGFFTVNLPLTDEPFMFEMEVPGHTPVFHTFHLGRRDGDIVVGESLFTYPPFALPGDVNKDNVIDIMDALEIKANWGKSTRDCDINFDGIVDQEDMKYVQDDFLLQNPYVDNAPKPVKKYKGTKLEDILKDLNIFA